MTAQKEGKAYGEVVCDFVLCVNQQRPQELHLQDSSRSNNKRIRKSTQGKLTKANNGTPKTEARPLTTAARIRLLTDLRCTSIFQSESSLVMAGNSSTVWNAR